MKLIIEATGEAATFGKTYKDFRGDEVLLQGAEPPRNEGSTGRVYTDRGAFYPSVIGMKWVRE